MCSMCSLYELALQLGRYATSFTSHHTTIHHTKLITKLVERKNGWWNQLLTGPSSRNLLHEGCQGSILLWSALKISFGDRAACEQQIHRLDDNPILVAELLCRELDTVNNHIQSRHCMRIRTTLIHAILELPSLHFRPYKSFSNTNTTVTGTHFILGKSGKCRLLSCHRTLVKWPGFKPRTLFDSPATYPLDHNN